MSYIRATSIYRYVDEENPGDYIFCSVGDPDYIEDYGNCSDSTLVEFFAQILTNETDVLFAEYLMRKLADRLQVKLRPKPLTIEEEDRLYEEQSKRFREEINGREQVS